MPDSLPSEHAGNVTSGFGAMPWEACGAISALVLIRVGSPRTGWSWCSSNIKRKPCLGCSSGGERARFVLTSPLRRRRLRTLAHLPDFRLLNGDEAVPRLVQRADDFVELGLERLAFPVLAVLEPVAAQ